jgi:hypothetical protein
MRAGQQGVPHYLLPIYQPDAENHGRITARLHRLNEELRESGSCVFTGGLHAPSSAAVVRAHGMITDGPYLEGKEHAGGIWVIAARLDAALRCHRPAAPRTDPHTYAGAAIVHVPAEPVDEGTVPDDRLRLVFTCSCGLEIRTGIELPVDTGRRPREDRRPSC